MKRLAFSLLDHLSLRMENEIVHTFLQTSVHAFVCNLLLVLGLGEGTR